MRAWYATSEAISVVYLSRWGTRAALWCDKLMCLTSQVDPTNVNLVIWVLFSYFILKVHLRCVILAMIRIFGILRQMKETFEANLSDAQKEELANQKAYEDLKAAKEAEIAAGQAQIDTKTQELADTDEKLAQAKEDIEDTRNSLAADEQFLMMLKEKCQMTDKEWEERQKTRQLEMEAVSKAHASKA